MEYRKNDCVTVTIDDMGMEGEGIGKVSGFTLFVKDTVPGDTVKAKIVKCKKNYAYARLEKVLSPSPFRVEPKCVYHRQCGGCQIQTLSYEKQLEFKQRKIRNNLIRIGGFSPEYIEEKMESIVGMEEPFHYRNKAQYPVGTDKDGNVVTGFYAGRTHTIIANTECSLGPLENQQILEIILKHMDQYHISPYDETTGKGLVRHVLIRKGFTSGEIMVCLVINKVLQGRLQQRSLCNGEENRRIFKADRQTESLRGTDAGVTDKIEESLSAEIEFVGIESSEIDSAGIDSAGIKPVEIELAEIESVGIEPAEIRSVGIESSFGKAEFIPAQGILLEELVAVKGMTSVSVCIHTERTNVIMGKEIHTLWGSSVISDTIHVRDMKKEGYPFTGKELTFHISPLSFYQVNPVQTEKLYSIALEYAGLTGEETVWDLYCGIGTISLFLAGNAKKVFGVEVIPQAVEDARENARRNGIHNAEFFVGKAEEILPEFYGMADMLHPDVIVVDPPRKGCDAACLDIMLKMQPERIVYVSCDSATLARDVKVLCEGGYEIVKVRGVDQFGMTVHVESIVLLSKLHTKQNIEVELAMSEIDLTATESKATYEEIKEYVQEHTGLKVSNLYIAQIKQKCGIIERKNYNLQKSENSRQPKCPPEKEKAIREALEYFQMI